MAVLQSSSNMARLPLRRAASAGSDSDELLLGLPLVRWAETPLTSCAGEAGALEQVLAALGEAQQGANVENKPERGVESHPQLRIH